MSTFSLPKTTKSYQPKPSKANYIEPGKRSVSTACPTIVVDKDGSVKMVVGGSGALRITSGVPMVRNLVLFIYLFVYLASPIITQSKQHVHPTISVQPQNAKTSTQRT